MSQMISTMSSEEISKRRASANNPPTPKQGGSKASNLSEYADRDGFWAGVDYLTFSHPRNFQPGHLCRQIETQFQSTGEGVTGDHGYVGKDICGGLGKVLVRRWPNSGDGDVLVRLPGRALDWIRDNIILSETELQCTDAEICRYFKDLSFSSTRIDIAMDTTDASVSAEVVEKLINLNSFVCRGRRAGINDSWDTEKPQSRGVEETVYLGSRSSSRFFRCYNKAADIFRKTGRKIPHLTRFELECKGDATQKVVELVAQKGIYCIPALFAGWVDFKDPTDETERVKRRRRVDWWERLVGGQRPIALGLQREVTTPEQSLRWIKEQAAKTLFLAHQHGLFDEIIEAINANKYKVKPEENEKWKSFAGTKKPSA